jgi:hypothetical protein
MVERGRKFFQRTPVLVLYDQSRARLDGTDARELEIESPGERLEIRVRRSREAQLVVIATREQTLERQSSLAAGEQTLALERGRTRQATQFYRRADARSFEDVTEIADQPIRNIDGRAGQTSQLHTEGDARGRAQERSFAVRKIVGSERDAPAMVGERQRGVAQLA